MSLIRKDVDYAIRSLIYLALHSEAEREQSKFISASALARELGLPLHFLRRICSELIRAGILETREGKRGGVRLGKKCNTINIREIIEIFHGTPELSECTFRKTLCPNRKTCVLRRRILAIEESVIRQFEAITIRELVDDVRAG